MIITTRGIVFRFTKYRETSIISNIYTEEFGLGTYIINGVRSAKSKIKIGYFEPLNLIEFTVYHKPGRNIERITDIKSTHPIHSIRQNVYKSAISLFLVELLNKCIIERDKNLPLFDYLYNAILTLEQAPQNNNFHLQFMLKLSSFIGFGIHEPTSFVKQSGNENYYKEAETMRILQRLIEGELTDIPTLNTSQRTNILTDILHYYQLKLEITPLKSLEVLHTVFS